MYSMEQEIEQLQAEVAAGVRGNEVLQREIRNTLDNLSINTHQLKNLKLQVFQFFTLLWLIRSFCHKELKLLELMILTDISIRW